MRGSRVVRVHTPPQVDWQGDPVDGATGDSFDMRFCAVLPHDSTEDTPNSEYVSASEDVFVLVRPDRAPTASDELEILDAKGETDPAYPGRWQVVGRPLRYENKRAIFKALRVSIQQVGTGAVVGP